MFLGVRGLGYRFSRNAVDPVLHPFLPGPRGCWLHQLLAFLSRTWRENRWSEWPLERLTGDARLRELWEQEGRGPAWPEFIECWLGEPSSMPELSFAEGSVRGAAGAYSATVVIRNAGACGADVSVEFRGAGGESLTRWVYVHRKATLSVSLPWRPVTAVVDPHLWTFEAATDERTLHLAPR